jgi:hypothetical protein
MTANGRALCSWKLTSCLPATEAKFITKSRSLELLPNRITFAEYKALICTAGDCFNIPNCTKPFVTSWHSPIRFVLLRCPVACLHATRFTLLLVPMCGDTYRGILFCGHESKAKAREKIIFFYTVHVVRSFIYHLFSLMVM